MLKKMIAVRFALSLPIVLFFVASSFAGRGVSTKPTVSSNPETVDCSTVTDEQIEDRIGAKLLEAFPNATERRRFLLFDAQSVNRVVTITGGVPGKKLRTRIINVISSVECVLRVNARNLKPTRQGGCDPSTQQLCNGICIPINGHCLRIP